MSDNYQSFDYDVLVIGAGGAGLRAAIEASAAGCKTGLVCKSLLGKAHTVMAEGGIAAALATVDPRDSWQQHFTDTMIGGNLGNHWRMAQIHAQQAPDRVRELEKWGAVFDRTTDGKGNMNVRHFGGHTYKRLAHVGDRTGLELIRTLQDKGVHSGIDVHMECTIYSLVKDGERIAGAFGYFRETGRPVLFRAKSVILATGGIGKIYFVNSNSWECTADGFALGYLAGAELADMEYIQFHPTGMCWPPSVRGILITEGVRGEGGVLKNNKGERFMFKYIPPKYQGKYADTEAEADAWFQKVVVEGQKEEGVKERKPPELMSRDVVARALWTEIKEGRGGEHGGVFLDIASRRTPEDIKKKLPSMYHQFKQLADVDITKVPMEIAPTCHYMMGGLKVDPDTQATNVPGLFASGECAAGMHGSNRLGGNSLSDLVVFGKLAGEHAAAYAKKLKDLPKVDESQLSALNKEMNKPFDNPQGGEVSYKILADLQHTMEKGAGMYREEGLLEQCLKDLEGLKARLDKVSAEGNRMFNPGWHVALDLRNMLAVAEAITRAAKERKESRGGHTRTDYTGYSKDFAKKRVLVRQKGGKMEVVQEDLPQMPAELEKELVDGHFFKPEILKQLRGEG
ncbi:MAG TPA: fumarate reductase/succinate dehydrogenase flavoprotein subunit [bacterium]|nr:fumarate reductase/succinate dehydrogenase flavoprotein subunit [bacterium]